jgi:hypothetical protein
MRHIAAMLGVMLAATTARAAPPAWGGFAANDHHTAPAPAAAQGLAALHWTTPVDDAPQYTGDELLIHYGSPMITAANTVLVPVKGSASGNFRIEAHAGASGALLWQQPTDYTLPPHDWVPPLPAVLTPGNVLAVAGIGGTVIVRATPDSATGHLGRAVFYGLAAWRADPLSYNAAVSIDTPITADAHGNLYFGFVVTQATPAGLRSGIARIAANGQGTWIGAAAAARDSRVSQVAMNCAPALSPDGGTVYIAVSNGGSGYLLGLDAATLAPKYRAPLRDPASGQLAWIFDDSSASPTVGPDGDVYYGVLEEPFPSHDDRGWLLHFDATLSTPKTPGSFGWDNTVSVVPTGAIPGYTGASPYLLMSKDNNYLGLGPDGDGHNRIAVMDPDVSAQDPYASTQSMAVVQSVLGPTPYPGAPAGAVYEWCINSAVVDAGGGGVIANSEDGHVYHWNLATNTLDQAMLLNPPRPEAYTMTVIGPDGTAYAINNSTLYALGAPPAR